MRAAQLAFVLPVAIAFLATGAFASSIETTDAGTEEAAAEGRPYEYDGPVCREARARAESAAQVPGFDDRLQEIIAVAPECFEGWEPEGN